jgi:hypothetical protein
MGTLENVEQLGRHRIAWGQTESGIKSGTCGRFVGPGCPREQNVSSGGRLCID